MHYRFKEAAEQNGCPEVALFREIIDGLSDEDRALWYKAGDLFDAVSGTACPTDENVDKYDPEVERLLALA